MTDDLSRRQVLAGGIGAAAVFGMSKTKLLRNAEATAQAAAAVPAAGSDLGAVQHVVFLMHENRSFDHYFGSLGGVDGFNTKSAAFAQPWPKGAHPTLLPFHLDSVKTMAECTYDLDHSWTAEHASWNHGAMNKFVATHTSTAHEGPALGTMTMGYYTSKDLPYYYALAKNFTICDRYFCSVLGPTHPNRMLQMTGTLDPAGTAGGPILTTNSNILTDTNLAPEFTCSWTTMPEVLQDAGVSWKVYNPYGPNYVPPNRLSMLTCKNTLMYFDQYQQSKNPTLFQNAFGYTGPNVPAADNGLTGGVGPNDFATDVQNNTLPAVSWIIPPVGYDEHPPAPPALGEWYTSQIVNTLMSNPEVWASTVLFIMYDENDGWFDHVKPPTPPAGTAGEFVTAASSAAANPGPVGLGFRVPMLVVSPFSVGGWVNSDVSDHTSQLKFLAARFGVTVPNISAWRNKTVSDLTGTLPALAAPVTKTIKLPVPSSSITAAPVGKECTTGQLLELNPKTKPYPIPKVQKQPKQEVGKLKRTPK